MNESAPAPDERSALAPVLALARSELRRRWRALALIGLLAGIVGATTVGAVSLARRTTTAYDRLGTATGVDDARGTVLVHADLLQEVVSLPMVTERWTGRFAVAQVDDDQVFLGLIAGPEEPSPLGRPILLDGRLPGSATGGVIEIALREDFQRAFDIPLGTELPVRFLDQADYFRFDTGFEGGAPHGPPGTFRVVGTVRLAGGSSTVPPAFAGPEALSEHPDAFLGWSYFVRLRGGSAAFDDFEAAVEELSANRALPPEGQEFVVADASSTGAADAAAENTAGLLGRGLGVLAVTVALVGGFALVQALARHHAAGASAHEVERALGLTRAQQVGARLLAGAIPTATAALVTVVGAVATAGLEPIGAIYQYEPNPGRAVNVAVIVGGALIAALVVLIATGLTSDAAQRRRPRARPMRESSLVQRATRLGGSPPTVIGLRFALEPGRGHRAVPVRSALIGATVGLAGVVAGLVFVASLDGLVDSPVRSAVPFDALVSGVELEDLQGEVLDSPLVGGVAMASSAPVTVDGLSLQGHAITDVVDELDIGLADGRLPRTPDEIVLGLRAAADLDKGVGDTVTLRAGGGEEYEQAVVGTGVVPTINGEELGLNALLTPEALAERAVARPFSSALVQAAPGRDPRALIDFLAGRFEADEPGVPVEVQNLSQLGRLPAVVAGLVGLAALLALANALVAAVRRRDADLAVLRAIGFTRRQTVLAVVVMGITIASLGVIVGLPLGVVIGSSLWRTAAEGAFVLSDARLPGLLLALPAGTALVAAVVAALVPGRRAARQSPVARLRVE